ncbi:MAG: flagellar protein FlaG [Alcanivorax sp.]|jgi:flagellar protein FlaG
MSGSETSSIQPSPATASTTQAKPLASGVRNEGQTEVESGNKSPQEPVPLAELVEVVSNISDYVQSITRDLEFRVDDVTGDTVINVYDSKTEALIRQIPSEEVITMAHYIDTYAPDPLKGLLLDVKG